MAEGDPEMGSSHEAGQPGTAAPSLGRQSSIYMLTLDELQNTLCESGKSFGSMNMDEFLNSIWTAEENQAQARVTGGETAQDDRGAGKEPSLTRQGSLSLPEPLCRKTVDQVWSEIHGNHLQNNGESHSQFPNPNAAQEQPTFGEMTLEDFLIRAGVVREQNYPAVPTPPPPPQQLMYHGMNFVARPEISGGVRDSHDAYTAGMKRIRGYPRAPQTLGGSSFGNDAGAGFGRPVQGIRVGSPASPVSLDPNQNGIDLDARGGRKRIFDGPVEKVVERRQRRMIKNRESAARSRARKQVLLTVELQNPLNILQISDGFAGVHGGARSGTQPACLTTELRRREGEGTSPGAGEGKERGRAAAGDEKGMELPLLKLSSCSRLV